MTADKGFIYCQQNAEKWKIRQYYAFKAMEEKKIEFDKEVKERNEKAIKRSEILNNKWKKEEGMEVNVSLFFKFNLEC